MDNLDNVLKQKNALNVQLQTVLNNLTIETFNGLLRAGSIFYSRFEDYIVKESESVKTKVQREDLLDSIKNIFDFSLQYFKAVEAISGQLHIPFQSPQNLLATSQQLYAAYRKKNACFYRTKFQKLGLSVIGFDCKKKLRMGIKHYEPVPLVLGVVVLCITIILAFALKIDTGVKYLIIRVLVSLSLALILRGVFNDFIELKINVKSKYTKIAITALGAFAIFLLTYFFNPAKPPEYLPESQIEKKND